MMQPPSERNSWICPRSMSWRSPGERWRDRAVEVEVELAVEDVEGLLLDLVEVPGVVLAGKHHDELLAVLPVQEVDDDRAEAPKLLGTVMVAELHLELRAHGDAGLVEHPLGVVDGLAHHFDRAASAALGEGLALVVVAGGDHGVGELPARGLPLAAGHGEEDVGAGEGLALGDAPSGEGSPGELMQGPDLFGRDRLVGSVAADLPSA